MAALKCSVLDSAQICPALKCSVLSSAQRCRRQESGGEGGKREKIIVGVPDEHGGVVSCRERERERHSWKARRDGWLRAVSAEGRVHALQCSVLGQCSGCVCTQVLSA